MKIQQRCARLAGAFLVLASIAAPAGATSAAQTPEAANTALIEQAFENWKQGTGSVFDLLAEESEWTVAGVSPVSGTYRSRDAFMKEAAVPINAKFATPLVPDVKHILAQGEHVVVLWDGTATAKDGRQYENSYAWHMRMQNGQITRVTAFLDTWRLVELME